MFLIAILLPLGVLSAQTNAERVINGAYTRSHDYDLLHQRIEVSNFDWDSLSFNGRVTTTLVSLRPGLDSIVLDMGRTLEVRTVTAACGRRSCPALDWTHAGDSLVVLPPRPAAFRDTVRFTVDYHGLIEQGRGLYFFRHEPGRPHRPQQVYSGGGTDGNPRWLPTYGAPNDKETWDVIATVPAGFTAVSNGRLVSDRRLSGGQRVTHWSQEKPASTYLIALTVAPFVKLTDRSGRIPLEYYVYPEDSALARPLFGVTRDMMETFSRLTGVAYPWSKYAQTTVADFVGGMENVGATTLVDWLPDARAYVDRPWYQHSLIPHELAHQWFGNLVTTENWANYWLNEGLAEFMPGQYWGAKLGRHAEDEYYLAEYRQFIEIDRRKRMPLATYNSNNVYPKGALVMEMLKRHLGPERFWAGIRRYLTRYAYGTATSDDLRQAFLEATGENLGWFWWQWIYQAGYPEFAVESSYDSNAHALTLLVKQTQRDTIHADSTGFRFATPEVFRAPITIRVRTAAGDLVRQVVLDRREQSVRIDSVLGQPQMVVFDDENVVLKKLVFDQPTPWLATQLATHPDLWNRSWAIDQLARRTADTVAARALSEAALRADYFITRAEAVGALRRFPPTVSAPVLTAAARDTSAQVRQAVMIAFGTVGGKEGLAVVRRAWESDPSYEVRAAALSAMVELDVKGSRAAVLAGLRTPSYREVIQNAAITAVVEHPDSELVAGLEQVAGDQPLPIAGLAALAARGVGEARSALERRLADDRPWVREWAREAIEGQRVGS